MDGVEEVKKENNEEKQMEGVESSQAQEQEPEMTPGKSISLQNIYQVFGM